MGRPRAIRATAWLVVAGGVAAPLVRRRLRAPAVTVQALAFAAPVGLCVAVRRSRSRDVATWALQMWAYLAAYKTPHDDAVGQAARAHVDYPIVVDRLLGLGELPTVRLQRALAKRDPDGGPQWRALDRVLVWAHWLWFTVPHGALAFVLLRRPERFTRAAAMTGAVFDLGAVVYWLAPTAPPWFAAPVPGGARGEPLVDAAGEAPPAAASLRRPAGLADAAPGSGLAGAVPGPGRADTPPGSVGAALAVLASGGENGAGPSGRGHAAGPGAAEPGREAGEQAVRRMMVEYGESFWQDRWGPLYDALGGNPLAAMPSLHLATSAMAALLLAEVTPVAGAVGAGYTAVLGFALVYLGEHYVVDLLAGLVLTGAVYRLGPRASATLTRLVAPVKSLEARAHGE